MILKEYFENQLNMAKDIHETTYYNQLNSQEKEDFLEEHREFGNEILGLE